MTGTLWNLLSFMVALAILIAVHEWGHFWVARRCGVRVERFSLGFGKVLWSRQDRQGTHFSLSLIPLGGYVKMLDERLAPVPEELRSQAFNNKSVGQRFAIVAAGPLANFGFALLALWLMFLLGIPGLKPVLGEVLPETPAQQAGFQPGMEIRGVAGSQTRDWEAVTYALLDHMGEGRVEIQVAKPEGGEQLLGLSLADWKLTPEQPEPLASLGLVPVQPQITLDIAQVLPGGAGERAGLQAGDRLQALDGQVLADWNAFAERVRAAPEQSLQLQIVRNGSPLILTLTPERRETRTLSFGYAGLAPKVLPLDERYRIELHYGPLEALGEAGIKTWALVRLTVSMLGKLLSGAISLDNLSGPVAIAQGAGSSAAFGLVYFLGFLALVSVNLGIINLFPLPVLDGGHLLFFAIEALTGRPVPDKIQEIAFKIGAAILIILMGIALFNDFARL